MSREIIEDRIMQLIFLSEVNLICCKVIYKFINEQIKSRSRIKFFSEDWVTYLILSAVNHFSESISITHSLLHKSKNNKELSFDLYEKKFIKKNCFEDKSKTQDFLSEIKNIRKEFKNVKFSDIRDKIVDHKDFKNIGDPLVFVLNIKNYKIIEKLQEIIKNLKEVASKFFEAQISYNLSIDYKGGLKKILESFADFMSINNL